MKKSQPPDSPLSVKNIISGILITVIGGVILAFIIQDARFSPSHTPTAVPITITPAVTVTQPPLGFKYFDHFSGVFSLYYPAEFEQVMIMEPTLYREYGYILKGTVGEYIIEFSRISETSLSDDEWEININKTMSGWLSETETRTLLETQNSKNNDHSFLFEAKDTAINCYILYLMEESNGIEMVALVLVNGDKWAMLRDNIIVSLDSINWSAIEARKIITSQ